METLTEQNKELISILITIIINFYQNFVNNSLYKPPLLHTEHISKPIKPTGIL